MVTPQLRAAFLAAGELTNCPNAGFFTYPQKHGFCSFNLPQQTLDGFADFVKAGRHELNSAVLHVTASAGSGASHRSTATTTTAKSAAQDAFFILKLVAYLCMKESNGCM
jgi:hypothetical protein